MEKDKFIYSSSSIDLAHPLSFLIYEPVYYSKMHATGVTIYLIIFSLQQVSRLYLCAA